MRHPLRTAGLSVAGLALGSGAGLFLVGVGLFADGLLTERFVLLAVVVASFALLGALLGWFAGRGWPIVGLALGLPPVAIAILLGEGGALTAAYAFCSFSASVGAMALAARRRGTIG